MLANSIRRHLGNEYQLACVIGPNMPTAARALLNRNFDLVKEIRQEEVLIPTSKGLGFTDRYRAQPELMFNKLHILNLTNFERLIYLDADMVAVHSLKDCIENLARMEISNNVGMVRLASNRGEDEYSAGLILFKPSGEIFHALKKLIVNQDSPALTGNTDQTLLNRFFKGRIIELPRKLNYSIKELEKELSFPGVKLLRLAANQNNFRILRRSARILLSVVISREMSMLANSGGLKIAHFDGPKPWIKEPFEISYWDYGKRGHYRIWDQDSR